ncbi:MAG: DUF493 domain-containing protein [Candidatus Melainabacteria bacterium HGW-Melainabacteria-1]|nr:MAG: DUF493 domain-containing protein [Candidatus Melainabacteria bacterium HGW-Melainabacteria-1]
MHEKFKALLEEEHIFPTEFRFTFIVPTEEVDTVQNLLNNARIRLRASSNNRYTSVSAWMKLSSSEEVVYVYEKMRGIPGIIAL